MIRHVVMFKFKPEIAAPDRAAFVAALKNLPSQIPGILAPEVGVDFLGSPRSYHAALIFGFADRAGLEAYAKHPNHQPVLARAREICEAVAAVDFEA
jgi:hypothetical protein